MLLEALVLTVCVGQYNGCNQATSAYYEQSADLKKIRADAERLGKKIGDDITRHHEWIVIAAAPAYAIMMRQPAKILVYKGTTLNLDPWKQAVGLQWNY